MILFNNKKKDFIMAAISSINTSLHCVQPRRETKYNGVIQKSLLVATVTFSALALVPPLRLAGALGLRCVSVLASTANTAQNWKQTNGFEKFLNISKIALCVLGLA